LCADLQTHAAGLFFLGFVLGFQGFL